MYNRAKQKQQPKQSKSRRIAENGTDHVIHYSEQNVDECGVEPSNEDNQNYSDEEIVECDYGNQNDQSISDSELDGNENLKPNKGLIARQIFNSVMNQSNILPSVPKGLKSNCYFVVYNEQNVKKKENKENCEYHDDCGALMTQEQLTWRMY